jgi:hypothetical protein
VSQSADAASALAEISTLASQRRWLDSPHALTEIRNNITHPERPAQYSNAYFEAWSLGLWYLELALLRICGYNGSYSNRLVAKLVGEVEDVPWR